MRAPLVARILLTALLFALLWVRCVALNDVNATTSLAQATLGFYTLFVVFGVGTPPPTALAIRWTCLLIAVMLLQVVTAADVSEASHETLTVDIITLVFFLVAAALELFTYQIARKSPVYEAPLIEDEEEYSQT
jgi:uncharacterized membrane protein YoaT (DUF817 family)